ncbi:MAG: 30S ribosomal protein S16 [Patescibacteria group bacterium]
MSIKIRLAKTGKKNAPAYKVVVAQTRTKRNGKYLDILGDFNPTMGGKPVIDKAKLDEWVKKGALITDPVKKMIEGTYKYVKYNPKAEKSGDKEDKVVAVEE